MACSASRASWMPALRSCASVRSVRCVSAVVAQIAINATCFVWSSLCAGRRVQQTVLQMYANEVEVTCSLCSLWQSRRFVRKQPQLL